MERMDGGMPHAVKSRTESAVHVEIGNWMSNPSKWLEVVPINRHVWRALQEELEARKDELRLYLGQELRQE